MFGALHTCMQSNMLSDIVDNLNSVQARCTWTRFQGRRSGLLTRTLMLESTVSRDCPTRLISHAPLLEQNTLPPANGQRQRRRMLGSKKEGSKKGTLPTY